MTNKSIFAFMENWAFIIDTHTNKTFHQSTLELNFAYQTKQKIWVQNKLSMKFEHEIGSLYYENFQMQKTTPSSATPSSSEQIRKLWIIMHTICEPDGSENAVDRSLKNLYVHRVEKCGQFRTMFVHAW